MIVNTQFNSRPLVVHAQGPHDHKPHWRPIREAFFASAPRQIGPIAGLTIVTCNNGHESMGILERSLDHLGIPYLVYGQGLHPWSNAKHKPEVLAAAAREVETEHMLYIDSRDAILLGDPRAIVDQFTRDFTCDLVFGADRMNWPSLPEFRAFEDSLPGAAGNDFRYLNGGAWIGKTAFCREFFDEACRTDPSPEAPDSEQGILKKLLMKYHPRVQLDYRCAMFQNIGFVFGPIIEIR